jgi:hypothetical protein
LIDVPPGVVPPPGPKTAPPVDPPPGLLDPPLEPPPELLELDSFSTSLNDIGEDILYSNNFAIVLPQ